MPNEFSEEWYLEILYNNIKIVSRAFLRHNSIFRRFPAILNATGWVKYKIEKAMDEYLKRR